MASTKAVAAAVARRKAVVPPPSWPRSSKLKYRKRSENGKEVGQSELRKTKVSREKNERNVFDCFFVYKSKLVQQLPARPAQQHNTQVANCKCNATPLVLVMKP